MTDQTTPVAGQLVASYRAALQRHHERHARIMANLSNLAGIDWELYDQLRAEQDADWQLIDSGARQLKAMGNDAPSIAVQIDNRVRYNGDLPDGWDRAGFVVAIFEDASGDAIATVDFGPGRRQDIPVSELDAL